MSSKQKIWREGGRIRRTDGVGYSDAVSDDVIRASMGVGRDPLSVVFAQAVLAIRAFERASLRVSS